MEFIREHAGMWFDLHFSGAGETFKLCIGFQFNLIFQGREIHLIPYNPLTTQTSEPAAASIAASIIHKRVLPSLLFPCPFPLPASLCPPPYPNLPPRHSHGDKRAAPQPPPPPHTSTSFKLAHHLSNHIPQLLFPFIIPNHAPPLPPLLTSSHLLPDLHLTRNPLPCLFGTQLVPSQKSLQLDLGGRNSNHDNSTAEDIQPGFEEERDIEYDGPVA